MKILMHYTLAGLLAACIQVQAVSKGTRSIRQPFPERGFWVTETSPDHKSTIVRYYAHSNLMLSEVKEPEVLDIRRLSVRKYLNAQLLKALKKDTTGGANIRLYEIR